MNHLRRALAAAMTASIVLVPTLSADSHAATAHRAKTYKNCDAMHRDYPHGVGRKGAKDKTSGTPVTNFKRSNALYAANSGSDRDGDKIACEAA